MAMTTERFEGLIKQLEVSAKRNPGAYRLRVRLLALLGYGYVFLILSLAIAMVVLLLQAMISGHMSGGGIRLIIFGVVIIFLILKALWVRMSPPEHTLELTRANAPGLFTMLDEL